MIIVELSGGLGNQLFQYAAGLSLAKHHGEAVKVDISLLNKSDSITGSTRYYDLHYLSSPPVIATNEEINRLNKVSWICKYYQKILPYNKRQVYKEKSFCYDPHFFHTRKDLYLKGLRQSERYFRRYNSFIQQQYLLSETKFFHLQDFKISLKKIDSISVHIRRGDYLTPIAQNVLGLLPNDYYTSAIELIRKKVKKPVLYVFSDDIEWVRNNFSFGLDHYYVSGDISQTSIDDFYLMQHCKHNIIANSSFSWWAAWLNDNPDKIVIAPKKWFNKAPLDTKDLIPESWITL